MRSACSSARSYRSCPRSCWIAVALSWGAALVGAEPPAPIDAAARVEHLRRELAEHDVRYHRDAAPVISDEAYDALRYELDQLETAYPELAEHAEALSDDRTPGRPTAAHHAPMLSLLKAYSTEQLEAFYHRTIAATKESGLVWVVEPKYDGVALGVVYEHGRFVRALSRGNGREGEDLTAQVRALAVLPEQLPDGPRDAPTPPVRIELRGELFLPLAAFRQLNAERAVRGEPPLAHPRSAAAGALQQRADAAGVAPHLALVFHGFGDVQPLDHEPVSLRDFRDRLQRWGLPVVAWQDAAVGFAELARVVEERRPVEGREAFPTDGLVVKVDVRAVQRRLGASGSAPRWAVARKFPAQGAATRLQQIVWQVGRTGVLTPVAEFEPVRLQGAVLRRASLFGPGEIERHDLHVGDWLEVERAGGVIPVIKRVDPARRPEGAVPVSLPRRCPACGDPVEESRAELRCTNEVCSGRICRQIEHFASRDAVGIAGLGPSLIARLVQEGRLSSIADVYDLDLQDLPGRGGARVLAAIEESRARASWRFIHGLGWPQVGAEASRVLDEHYGSLTALLHTSREELQRVRGLSPAAAARVAEQLALAAPRAVLERLALIRERDPDAAR